MKPQLLPHEGIPMTKEYEEMMQRCLPNAPRALIIDAWKHNATPIEVMRHLDRISNKPTGETK